MKYDLKIEQRGSSEWYMWNEKCDKCGKVYRTHSIMSSKEPNFNEVDYCISCLKEVLKMK